MSRRLKLPRLWIEWELRSREGKVVERGRLESQTRVGNVVAFFSDLMGIWRTELGTGLQHHGRGDIVDVGGALRYVGLGAVDHAATPFGGAAPVGNLDAGIIVGSDATPVAVGQYDLVARIAHGTGTGQLQYGATGVEELVKGATWTLRIIRTFTNASGATITVREFGLFLCLPTVVAPHRFSFMLARDVPSPPIEVPDGYTLTVRYIISHTV